MSIIQDSAMDTSIDGDIFASSEFAGNFIHMEGDWDEIWQQKPKDQPFQDESAVSDNTFLWQPHSTDSIFMEQSPARTVTLESWRLSSSSCAKLGPGLQVDHSCSDTQPIQPRAAKVCLAWIQAYPHITPTINHLRNLAPLVEEPLCNLKVWFGLNEPLIGDDGSLEEMAPSLASLSSQEGPSDTTSATSTSSSTNSCVPGTNPNGTASVTMDPNTYRSRFAVGTEEQSSSVHHSASDQAKLQLAGPISPRERHPFLVDAEKASRDRTAYLGKSCEKTTNQSAFVRDSERPWQCTRSCAKTFARKKDWVRHELLAYPQEGWVCLLGAGAQSENEHVQNHHYDRCSSSRQSTRRGGFYRFQHFVQHFKNIHPHLDPKDFSNDCHFTVTNSKFPKACGFCPNVLPTWRTRIDHISNHFELDGLDMRQWADREISGNNSDISMRRFNGDEPGSNRDAENGNFEEGNNGSGSSSSGPPSSGTDNNRNYNQHPVSGLANTYTTRSQLENENNRLPTQTIIPSIPSKPEPVDNSAPFSSPDAKFQGVADDSSTKTLLSFESASSNSACSKINLISIPGLRIDSDLVMSCLPGEVQSWLQSTIPLTEYIRFSMSKDNKFKSVDHMTLELRSLSQDSNYAEATMKWIDCLDSLPSVRGTSTSEPSSTRPKPSDTTTGLCEYCATARILKELEQSMANDQDKTSLTDDDKDHYFPNLPHSGSVPCLVGSA